MIKDLVIKPNLLLKKKLGGIFILDFKHHSIGAGRFEKWIQKFRYPV